MLDIVILKGHLKVVRETILVVLMVIYGKGGKMIIKTSVFVDNDSAVRIEKCSEITSGYRFIYLGDVTITVPVEVFKKLAKAIQEIEE